MRLAVAFVVSLVAGCGRVGFGAADGGPGAGGDDAPGGNGDGPMVDAQVASACATTTIIDDAFTTSGMAGWTAVTTGTITMTEIGGVERFTVPSGAAANTRAALQLSQARSFVGTCAIAELSLAGSSANVRSYLRLGTPTMNMEMYVEADHLWGRFTLMAGGTGTVGPIAYNPQAMRFLRFRALGNQNYQLEYGPNLTTWMSLGSAGGSVVDPSPSYIEVGVLASGAVAAGTTAEFERVIFLGP